MAFSPSIPKHPQGAVQEIRKYENSLTMYIEGDVVEEMHKRHLNLSKTTEIALRKELFSERMNQ